MNANEVVVHGVDRDRMRMILGLLGEAVGQAREPARTHAQGQVSALGVAGADMLRIGAAFHPALLDADAFAGAVAARSGRIAINFHKHGVVDISAE